MRYLQQIISGAKPADLSSFTASCVCEKEREREREGEREKSRERERERERERPRDLSSLTGWCMSTHMYEYEDYCIYSSICSSMGTHI